ncbi:MAG TPA: AI-2E family transporter [Acidimicrobiia bacterium]|nr:AI-2E family transporter [Acidimicrobiia bacterium]
MNDPSVSYERLRRLGIMSWSVAGMALVVGGLVWLLYVVRILWPPLVLAGAFVYLMSPLVDRMQNWRIHRLLGSFVSYLLFLGLGVLFGFIVVPVVGDQLAEFADRIPQLVDDIGVFLVDLGERLGLSVGAGSALDTLQAWLADFVDQERIQQMLGQIGTFARMGLDVLIVLALGPVLAFYLLVDLPGFKDRARRLVPDQARPEVVHVVSQLTRVVGGFVRGQLLVALIVGVLSSVGLALLGVPFWLLIGLIAGFLNVVPFIGPFAGGVLAALVSLVFRDIGTALWAVIMFSAVQQLDNHVISPNILKSRVQLNPVFILLALLLGGSVGGFFGLLVAVPVTAALRVILGHVWRTRVLHESWDEAAEAMITEYEPPRRESLVGRLRRAGDAQATKLPSIGNGVSQRDTQDPDSPRK